MNQPAAFGHDEAVMRWGRLARTVVLGLIIGLGIANLYWSVTAWTLSDAGAYWQAAQRLREGGELYPAVADVEASEVYRYAPWFAWLTIPFTYLPQAVAGAIWSVVLITASVVAIVPLSRQGAWVAISFFFPILIGISAVGNVQALIVAALVWGVERRSGPLWIGLSASLKIVPIVLVLVYVGRREWWRAAATVAITVALVAPAFLYDLSGYVTTSGDAGGLIEVPVLFGLAVAAAMVATLALARGRYGWLAAATSAVVATPRLFVYDVTYVLVGGSSRSPATTPNPSSAADETTQRPPLRG
jgi:hypothetical protein